MKLKIGDRLSIKLIIAICALLIVFLSIYTTVTVSQFENYLTDKSLQNAYNISDVIKKSTRYSMLLNRREDVHQIINTIGKEADVEGIRVYNKSGFIIYSTNKEEIFKQVDMKAEACNVCHDQSTPHKTLTSQNKMRIYEKEKGKRLLGLINPIYNEQDCYTAGCHAHSPGNEILGVLDVMISLEKLDENIAEVRNSTITNSVILTLIIGMASGLFITILVNRPVKKLTAGLKEIGKGNLKYKIEVESRDELGMMGKSFNEMSEKLDKAYREIKDWSENLNQKVEEKSEELKNVYSQVIQIEKLASLGKLSATVAHELNNPLEGILTYSKLVSKTLKKEGVNGKNEKLIEFLNLISEESARCGKIVKDLLLFSHRGDDELIASDLPAIINKSIMLIAHHLEIHKINLIREFEKEALVLKCNPQKIQQALVALLINSIEAMPNGGKIIISLKDEEGDAVIRIKDEGAGINEKDLPQIFEPFFSTKDATKGTGLGLAVVYGIVKIHNGEIVVEDTSALGTTFKITLPITKNVEINYEPERKNINC